MAEEISVPFSARNRGAHAQIDNAFPETARIGLHHVLSTLVARRYVGGWPEVFGELWRIARVSPDVADNRSIDEILSRLPWEKVFDFCERLYGHLAQDVWSSSFGELITPRSEVQQYIAGELQRLFVEENLAFEFSNGLVRRRGRRNTADQVARAEFILGDPRLSKARTNFNKALRYFRNVSQPDYENVVKEAVCAVEATACALFDFPGSTLGDFVKTFAGVKPGELPKTIAKTFEGLYGFRSGGEGVGHGGATGGAVTKELAEYSLAVAASQIVLLVDFAAASESDIPF